MSPILLAFAFHHVSGGAQRRVAVPYMMMAVLLVPVAVWAWLCRAPTVADENHASSPQPVVGDRLPAGRPEVDTREVELTVVQSEDGASPGADANDEAKQRRGGLDTDTTAETAELASAPPQEEAFVALRPPGNAVVLCLASMMLLYVGCEVGYAGWVFEVAVRRSLLGESSASYLTSTFWGAITVGRLTAVPLTSYVRPKTVLVADFTGCVLAMVLTFAGLESATFLWIGTVRVEPHRRHATPAPPHPHARLRTVGVVWPVNGVHLPDRHVAARVAGSVVVRPTNVRAGGRRRGGRNAGPLPDGPAI